MDLLNQSVLPQSSHHLLLLKYLLALAYILFIPYVSVLFGSLSFSLFFKGKSEKSGENLFKNFSKDLIDLITFNKSVAFTLGVVPLLSSVFGYAQLLHTTGLNVPEFLLIALLLLNVAILLVYIYKYTFHLKDIFKYAEGKKDSGENETDLKDELESYSLKTGRLHRRSGFYALIFLTVSVYLFIASVHLAFDTEQWASGNNLLGLLFSLSAWIDFLQFIAGSFAITSAIILYRFFRPNTEIILADANYIAFIKNFALQTGLIATICLPVLIVLSLIARPLNTLSFDFFIATAVSLILLLIISVLYYMMLKDSISVPTESGVKYGSALIFLLIIVFALLVIKDQFAFDTSTKMQTEILSKEYDAYQLKIQEEMGTSAPISGLDIYNGRCIACHNFDKKIVGPSYNSTLPKYEGKKDLLVKYILNPVKVNPEYPPMPNQGLKPKEAEAIAEYLLTTYKK
ncbi:hypothetical protein C0389_01680 [bacterium]|nr:hypothetical protein [bacterium]